MKFIPDDAVVKDEQLVEMARTGSEEAAGELISRYRPIIKAQTSSYYMEGADGDDLLQEAMIGFFKAIQSYDPEKGASFSTFSNMCVKRQIISAVKTASRLKHEPLNRSVSLNGPVSEKGGNLITLADMIEDGRNEDPEKKLIMAEEIVLLEKNLRKIFSDLEKRVFDLRLEELSCEEIAGRLGCSVKTVDNAVSRVRSKLAKYF